MSLLSCQFVLPWSLSTSIIPILLSSDTLFCYHTNSPDLGIRLLAWIGPCHVFLPCNMWFLLQCRDAATGYVQLQIRFPGNQHACKSTAISTDESFCHCSHDLSENWVRRGETNKQINKHQVQRSIFSVKSPFLWPRRSLWMTHCLLALFWPKCSCLSSSKHLKSTGKKTKSWGGFCKSLILNNKVSGEAWRVISID